MKYLLVMFFSIGLLSCKKEDQIIPEKSIQNIKNKTEDSTIDLFMKQFPKEVKWTTYYQ